MKRKLLEIPLIEGWHEVTGWNLGEMDNYELKIVNEEKRPETKSLKEI